MCVAFVVLAAGIFGIIVVVAIVVVAVGKMFAVAILLCLLFDTAVTSPLSVAVVVVVIGM